MKRKPIRMCWTCCDACHAEHRTRLAAWLHWRWLRLVAWDEWRGDQDGNVTMRIKHLAHWRGYKLDLHKMVATDPPECFHTHPARAIRFVFRGGYDEQIYHGGALNNHSLVSCWSMSWSIVRPELTHRIHWLHNDRYSYSLWFRWPKTHDIELHGSGWNTR